MTALKLQFYCHEKLSCSILKCAVNQREVTAQSTDVGWQIVLNAFCAVDSFFMIG